jgi:hypothetical protein
VVGCYIGQLSPGAPEQSTWTSRPKVLHPKYHYSNVKDHLKMISKRQFVLFCPEATVIVEQSSYW